MMERVPVRRKRGFFPHIWFIASFERLMYAVAVALLLANTGYGQTNPEPVKFNIPAQAVPQALTAFAVQANIDLVFWETEYENVQARAVVGEFPRAWALQLLLEGTGLRVTSGPDGRVTVTRGQNTLAPSTTSSVTKVDTRLVAQATYDTGTEKSQATGVDSETARQPESPIADNEDAEETLGIEEILVTGSRIRGAQSASPVITITRQEIEQGGFATVEELIDKLPQNFGAGASLDTSTDSTENIVNVVGGRVSAPAGGTSVNLRGLGASSTLILLNGRRMSPSGLSARFVNISSIPVTAIERVDVLTDGASAIYGSDAIGGVVNFILRDNYEGAETRLRYGAAKGGNKPEVLFGQSFGNSWDDGNILFTYEYYESDNLAYGDRDRTSTNDLSRFGGTDWRLPGGNPANIRIGGSSGDFYAIPAGQDGTSLTAADFDLSIPRNLFNDRSVGDVIPALERHSALLHLTQDIGNVEVFAEAQFSSQEMQTRSNSGTIDINVPSSNPFFVDPTGTGLTNVIVDNYSFENDLVSLGFGEIDSYRAVLGVRFDIGEKWNGELAGQWTKEEATRATEGRLFPDAFAAAVAETDPNLAFNPFGDGPTNLAVLESVLDRSRQVGSLSENELSVVNFNIDGKLFDVPGGIARIATGVEFREDSLVSETVLPVASTADLSRDVLAVYAEFFFPLVSNSNSRPGLERLEVSVAGRYTDYSDFGNSTNPKVGLVWSPTQALTIKGTYGTSFKAPGLLDLDVTDPARNPSNYLGGIFVDLGIIPTPILVRVGNNENLKPEEATTWTAGFQWRPESVNGLSLDVTYFNVDFEDRIDFPTNDTLEAIFNPRFSTIFNQNPTQEQIEAIVNDPSYLEEFFGVVSPAEDILSGALPVGAIVDLRKTNLSQVVVTGSELRLAYQVDTAIGLFDIGLNGNYLFDFERRFIAADPLVDEVDTLGRPIDFRARGNVTWSRNNWMVSGFFNYMDGYTDNISDPERSVDSWTTVDLTIAYDTGDNDGFLRETRFSLTTRNLLDEEPPFVDTLGGLGYDSVNGDPIGRFLSLQVTKNW